MSRWEFDNDTRLFCGKHLSSWESPKFINLREKAFQWLYNKRAWVIHCWEPCGEALCGCLWRLTLVPAHVFHLHIHTMACLGSKCLDILPSPLQKKKKSRNDRSMPTAATKTNSKNQNNSQSSRRRRILSLTKATLRAVSCTKTFFYHRDAGL